MLMAIGSAALGALKASGDKRRYEDDKKLASTTTRFSPWTGLKGLVTAQNGNVMGGAIRGGLAGYLGEKNQMKQMSSYENVLSGS